MKYKALKKAYPPTVKFPENTSFVRSWTFKRSEKDRIPLFVGTQFGIFPKKYSSFKKFKGKKIAILGKSLLSGVQTDIKEYIINDETIKKIINNFGIIITVGD